MATPRKYFQDHFVLLLLSVNAFLAVFGIIFTFVRLGTSHGAYIVQYRPSLVINSYQQGSALELISFALFAVMIMAINSTLSYRAYQIHRQLAITILSLSLLLLTLSIIISNALLLLR